MEKINYKNIKISFIINILIVIMTVVALTISLSGFKFMHEYKSASGQAKIPIFSYFTGQSNAFMGIISLVYAIIELQILKGKRKSIPLICNILKFVATIAICLTFLVVFFYLGFVTEGGILALLKNGNLFFHLIIPVTSIITFIFFEKTDTIKFKHTIFGLLPTALYEIYYMINILSNMKNGRVEPIHDWYYLLQNDIYTAIIVAPTMLGVTYIITITLWRLNAKK